MVDHLCDEECGDPNHPRDGKIVDSKTYYNDAAAAEFYADPVNRKTAGPPINESKNTIIQEVAAHLDDEDVKLLSVVTNSIAYIVETEMFHEMFHPDDDPPHEITVPKERVKIYEKAALQTIQHIDQYFSDTLPGWKKESPDEDNR